ncbi:MAG: glycosyltransferase family 61 protein [Hyphomicrobiales bacterium]|nr:glycosyltransferase family 61 protein [Hyphomicrobiales bacterium]
MLTSFRRALVSARRRGQRKLERTLPSIPIDDASERLYQSTKLWADPELTTEVPQPLAAEYRRWLAHEDPAYVRRYRGNVAIDPWTGHIYVDRRIVWGSTDVEPDRARERSPRFLGQLTGRRTHHDEIISLHHRFDTNYFHFINNVLTKLPLVDRLGLEPDIPVVVPQRLARTPFFQAATARGAIGRRVIVQGDREIITARTVYTVKPHDPDRDLLDAVCDRLGVTADDAAEERIFIARGPGAANRRHLRNQSEIDAILLRYAVRKVDPQAMSLDEQIALFARCSLVVGPHGAGLTNILWRRSAPLTLVEMFNPAVLSPCYFMLARLWNHNYHCLLDHAPAGKGGRASSEADVDGLAALLERLTT